MPLPADPVFPVRWEYEQFNSAKGLHLFLLRIFMTDNQLNELLTTPFITQACITHRPMANAYYFSCGGIVCTECAINHSLLCDVHSDDISPSQLDYLKLNHVELFV